MTARAAEMDPIVERLSLALMPRFEGFVENFRKICDLATAHTFSHRHAPIYHCFGVCCYPIGKDELDPAAVALVVNISFIRRLGFNANLIRQSLSARVESSTAWRTPVFHKASDRAMTKFASKTLRLLPMLAELTKSIQAAQGQAE